MLDDMTCHTLSHEPYNQWGMERISESGVCLVVYWPVLRSGTTCIEGLGALKVVSSETIGSCHGGWLRLQSVTRPTEQEANAL